MNYQRIYEQLTAKDMIAEYTEKHHIIPQCIGGTDDPSNLVRLTPEAHYVAHQLLVKIYPDNYKLIFAANRMTSGKRRNNKMYGWLKRKHAEAMSNLNTGRLWSAERRAKTIGVHKGRVSPNKGKTLSTETKAKLSVASKGRIHTAETKAKISVANKGRCSNKKGSITSEETKAKISATKKCQPPLVCPYCNKEGSIAPMKQWHFEKCKLKPLDLNM